MKKESSEQQIRALRKFVRLHKPTLPAMSAPGARKPAPIPGGKRTTRSEAAKLRAERDLDGKVSPTIKFDSKQNEDSTESTDSQSEKQNTHSIKTNESQCRTNENQCKTNENQMETNSHQETAEERSTKKPRKKRISRALFRHDNIDYIKPKKQEMLQKTFSFTFKKLVDKSKEIYSKTDDQPNSEENETDKNKEIIIINDAISDTTKEVITSQNVETPVSSLSSSETNAQPKRLQHLILDMPSLDSPNAQSEFTQTEFSESNKTNTCSKQNTVTMAQRNAPQKKTNLTDTLSTKTPAVPKNVCHIQTNSSQYLQYPFYGILHNDQINMAQEEQRKAQSLNERQMRAQQQQMQVQQTIEEQLKRQQFEKQLKAQQRAQQPEQMKTKQMQQMREQQSKQMTTQQSIQEQMKSQHEEQIRLQQSARKQLTTQQSIQEQMKSQHEEQIRLQQLAGKQMTTQQSIQEQMKSQHEEQIRLQQLAGKQMTTQQSIQEQMKSQHEEQIRLQQLAGKQLTTQQSIQEQKRVQQSITEQLKRQQMRVQQTKQTQNSVEEQIPTFKITVLNPQQPKTNENDTFSPRFPLYPSYPQYLLPPQYQKILEKQQNEHQIFPEKMYPVHQAPTQYYHPNNPYRYPENSYIYPYLPPPYPHHLIPKQRQIWNPHEKEQNNKNLVKTRKETVNETEKNTTEDNYLRLTQKDDLRKINLEEKLRLENMINAEKLNLIRQTHEVKITQQSNPNCTIVKDTTNQQKIIKSQGNYSLDKNSRQPNLAISQEHQEPQLPTAQNHNFISQIPTVQNILHRFRNNQELHEKQNENIPQGQKRSGSPTVKTTKKRVSFDLNVEDKNNLLCSNNYAYSEMPNSSQTRSELKLAGPEERSTKESVIVSPNNRRATAEQTNEEKKLHLHNRNNNILFMQDKNHTPAENNKIMQCSVIKKVCTENKNKHSIENILSTKCSAEKINRTFEINNNKSVFNHRNDKNIEAINLNDNRYVQNISDDNLITRTVIKNHRNDLKIKSFEYETIQNNFTPSKISKRRKTLQHIDLTCDNDQEQHNSFTLEQQFRDNISLNDKHTLKNRLSNTQCEKNTQAEQKMKSINDQKLTEQNVEINMPKLINKQSRVETIENKTQENSRATSDNRLTIDSRVNNYACNNVPFPKPAHSNNKVNKTIETMLPLNLSLKNDAQKTNEPSDQNKRQSIIVNNKRNSVSGPLDSTNMCFVKNDEEYEGYLKLLKEKNAVGPYLFYEFVAKVRKRNNQPVFDLVTFFLLLKQGKLLEYKTMYNQCNKNN